MTGDFYQSRRGWLHRLDPRNSLIISLLLVVDLFFIQGIWAMAGALLVLHLLLLSASIPLKSCIRLWGVILPLMVMIFLLWPLFNRQGDRVLFSWRFIRITSESLLAGGVTALRLPALLLASYIPLMTHRQNALIRAWVSLGIPHSIGLILMLTLRFLPFFRESFTHIQNAQQMRGLDLSRGGLKKRLPMLVPLVVWALRTSENLSFALDSRGFNPHGKTSFLIKLKFSWMDLVVLFLFAGTSAALILLPLK